MRVLSRSTLLFLLLFLVACGPSRRGGGGGGGGGGGFDDDDSAADDDDAAPSAGTIAITSAPVTATLPALLVRSTNEFGTSLTLLGGTSDCAGYTAVAEASWSLYEEYSDENISLEDYTNGSAQGTADFFGLGAWMVTVLIESGEVDEGMDWDAGDFVPQSVLVGTADDEWNDRLAEQESPSPESKGGLYRAE